MKKIIIFTCNTNSYETNRISQEIKNSGLISEIYDYRKISIKLNKSKSEFLFDGKKIDFKDCGVILRNIKRGEKRNTFLQSLIINFLKFRNIPTLNLGNLDKYREFENKILQYQVSSDYTDKLITPVYYYNTASFYQELTTKKEKIFKFPIVMKAIDQSHGNGIHLIKDYDKLSRICSYKNIEEVIFQKYILNTGDIRAIVLGGKFLGAMLRKSNGNFVNNLSAGGTGSAINLNPQIQNELIKLANDLDADYLGFDIILSPNKKTFKILEINRYCQFKGFEKITGINFAGTLIKYFINKSK